MQQFPFNQDASRLETGSVIDFRNLMQQVYMWMVFGLATTAASAFVITESGLVNQVGLFGYIIAAVVQIGLVIAIQSMINTAEATTLGALFIVYSAVTGITFAVILGFYNPAVAANAFLTTCLLFGFMSVVGYTTHIDLTQFGALFMMAIVGLLIAIVVNIFLASEALFFFISVAGVIIFTALIAYDTQRLKNLARAAQHQGMSTNQIMKLAVIGALWLYLDFINLFIFLLRLLGSRD